MASGPNSSRVEEQPPALPVKQHRSHSCRRSSVGCDRVALSPAGLQHHNCEYDDDDVVFSEPTDCHAAQCPIHQRYDPSRHQVRFFSDDDAPPPVPKKRFARTLSLPGTDRDRPSPPSPPQRRPQNFDNPLYMLAPTPDTYLHEEAEEPVSFSQLTFDTPDEHLLRLFSRFDDQKVVSRGIQRRHLLFLRSVAQNVEAGILLWGEAAERDVGSYQLQDFLLHEGGEQKRIGDAVYYGLHSPKLPGRVLALRVHKHADDASSARTKRQPWHVNVQDILAATPPGGATHASINLTSVQSFLQKGLSVSVERDLPSATLEDFIRDSGSPPSADRLDYDRRVCVLLLQILTGSQHLCNVGAAAAELRPRGIFLVWPNKENEEGEETSRPKEEKERGTTLTLWRNHGSPRVVLTPPPSALSAPHHLTYIRSQIGALIQYCLHSNESAPPGPSRSKSWYRRGLLYLASLLQSESSGPQIADMAAMLQVLLWGPCVPLLDRSFPTTAAAHNWLTVKRALLVMKLAERGLIQDQSALDWEDCLCLRYLSFTDPKTVVSASAQLWLTLNTDGPSCNV